jgi:hypothetical protein
MDPANAPTVIPTVPIEDPAVLAACCGDDMSATIPTSAAMPANTFPTTPSMDTVPFLVVCPVIARTLSGHSNAICPDRE